MGCQTVFAALLIAAFRHTLGDPLQELPLNSDDECLPLRDRANFAVSALHLKGQLCRQRSAPHVQWAIRNGLASQAHWYTGLTASSELQTFVHTSSPEKSCSQGRCCTSCHEEPMCKGFVWFGRARCQLYGGAVLSRWAATTVVSGLSVTASATRLNDEVQTRPTREQDGKFSEFAAGRWNFSA